MVGKNLAPVIIERKKVMAFGGHHGGPGKLLMRISSQQ